MRRLINERTGRSGFLLVAALALAASACGSKSEIEATADKPESFEDIEWNSPIADFLGQDTDFDFSSDESQAEFAAQQAEAEEKVASCMRQQGFEYQPMDQGQFAVFETAEEELPYYSDAWVAKYGFGISTQRFSQSEVGPDLVGYDDQAMESFDEFEDPNQEYVNGLSEGEQEAYYQALYGTQPELDENATDEEWEEAYANWEPDGCQYEGQTDFFGGEEQQFYETFSEDLESLYERVEADQRVIDWRAEISACGAEKGFEFTYGEDMYNYFEEKLSGIGGGFAGDPFEGSGLDPEQMTEEELDQFYQNLNQLSPEDLVVLAEVQKEEIDMAKAMLECGGGDLNEAAFMNDIRVEYEEQFLVDNADRLSEFEGTAADQ